MATDLSYTECRAALLADAAGADPALTQDANPPQGAPITARLWRDRGAQGEQLALQFCGWALVLLPDGTYFLSDTSGG